MNSTKTISQAMQSYLTSVKTAVGNITDPSTGKPVQIPDYDKLYSAAGKLDTSNYPADQASVILALLGRASSYDFVAPQPGYQLSFPQDHHMHTQMGSEWYWIGCHLNVTDPNGNSGRLGVLVTMQKNRCIGITEQTAAGWSDMDTLICSNIATVTIDMDNEEQRIIRRNKNIQWTKTGGQAACSTPGENFYFQCGADSLSGSMDVLPLTVLIEDGDNMTMQLDLSANDSITGTPFFLQGAPDESTWQGTGLTGLPTPGIYYSWPQVKVTGSITVAGVAYTINSGSGWIDHQLMMSSLENPGGAAKPVPFVDDSKPYNGWTWQFFNLDNGAAFTGASFILGDMNTEPSIPYGYYISPANGTWDSCFMGGSNQLADFVTLPAPVCLFKQQQSSSVSIPTQRTYSLEAANLQTTVKGVATAWYKDGTFNNGNWSVASENPASYVDATGSGSNGLGFLETVGMETVDAYRARALKFLETGNSPCVDMIQVQVPEAANATTAKN